jgi:hypothetical protein
MFLSQKKKKQDSSVSVKNLRLHRYLFLSGTTEDPKRAEGQLHNNADLF